MTRTLPRSRALVLLAAVALSTTALAPATATASAAGTSAPRVTPTALPPVSLAAQARMTALLPQRVAAAKALGPARTGLVADLETGAAIWRLGTSTPMRGASTTKLATAITALRLLGTATRFPTRVVTGRTPTEVVLVGGGDPSLTSAQLSSLARATAAAVLASLAPAPATTSPRASIDGDPRPTPTMRQAPRTLRVTVRLDDTLYPSPTAATGWTSGYEPYVVRPVRPLVRDHRVGWDVAAEAASYFSARLSTELAALTAGRTDVAATAAYAGRLASPAAASEIARFAGNTSRTALARMLLISDNDIAEMLFRDNAIAAGRTGSWADATRTELEELQKLGVPTTGWALLDGSGVSRSDRVSAAGLVAILRAALAPEHPELWPLKAMLPVAGASGTLRHRFTGPPTRCAARKVFAKTGTLFDTIGLAGYALGSDNRLRAFAVLVHKTSSAISQAAVRQAVEVVPATATGCY